MEGEGEGMKDEGVKGKGMMRVKKRMKNENVRIK